MNEDESLDCIMFCLLNSLLNIVSRAFDNIFNKIEDWKSKAIQEAEDLEQTENDEGKETSRCDLCGGDLSDGLMITGFSDLPPLFELTKILIKQAFAELNDERE